MTLNTQAVMHLITPRGWLFTKSSRRHFFDQTEWKSVSDTVGSELGPYAWIGSWEYEELAGFFKIISDNDDLPSSIYGGTNYNYKSEIVLDSDTNQIFNPLLDPVIGVAFHFDL